MKDRVKKNTDIIVYIALMVSVYIVFTVAKAGMVGDDLWFAQKASSIPFGEYIKERYLLWSSRVLIEALEYFLVKHILIWKILTSFVYAGGVFLLSRLIENLYGKKLSFFIHAFFVFSLYSFRKEMFYGAGWVSTTVNYLWTASALILCIYLMNKLVVKDRLSILESLICIIACVFCVCQEITCPVALVFILLNLFRYLKKYKRVNGFFFVLLLIDILGFFNVFFCPGNDLRLAQETATWFPGFENLTLLNKIELGFSSTMQNFNRPLDPFGLLFWGFIFLAAVICIKSSMGKIMGAVPVVINIVFLIVRFDNLKIPPFEFNAADPFISTGTDPSFANFTSLWPDILFLLQILCTMIVLDVILNKEKAILGTVILVLGTGFMSRIAMGFSPTVWVSGIRTFFMLYLALAFTLTILSVKVFQKNKFALLFSVPFVVYGIIMNII